MGFSIEKSSQDIGRHIIELLGEEAKTCKIDKF